MSASAVYVGEVRHARLDPVRHDLRAPMGMLWLDLDELPGALDAHRGWGASRRALRGVRRSQQHGDPRTPLADAIRATCARETGRVPGGPTRLLVSPHLLGRGFNPVAFGYCWGADGELDAVLAEVTNTPWGERHAYVLDARAGRRPDGLLETGMDKAFHVSPLMGMDHRYRWSTTEPGEELRVRITSRDASTPEGRTVFGAELDLRRRPLDRDGLRAVARAAPLGPLGALTRIYVHALVERLKGAPWHAHPERARPAVDEPGPITVRRAPAPVQTTHA